MNVLRFCAGIALLVVTAGAVRAEEPLPSAQTLLEDVRARLPKEPIVIKGELEVRKRKGVVTGTLNVEMFLNLGSVPATAKYVIRDAFGKDLEQMVVTRTAGGSPRFDFAAGAPLVPAKVPDLFQPFRDTDMSWMDLTLSFLWWPGGKTLRTETIRGRDCYVVEVPAPAGEAGQYATVLLWVDAELHMVFQAEGYDAKGVIVRRLFIKSFKKFDERAMIKDMDVQSLPSDHRTNLRVESMHIEK